MEIYACASNISEHNFTFEDPLFKAGHYFGIEVRHVPLAGDDSMQPDLAQLERAIDSNTIMVSGSFFLANYCTIW